MDLLLHIHIHKKESLLGPQDRIFINVIIYKEKSSQVMIKFLRLHAREETETKQKFQAQLIWLRCCSSPSFPPFSMLSQRKGSIIRSDKSRSLIKHLSHVIVWSKEQVIYLFSIHDPKTKLNLVVRWSSGWRWSDAWMVRNDAVNMLSVVN